MTDRDEVFLEYTKSVCPVCKAVIDAQVNVRDNKVYLRKRCARARRVRGAGVRRRRDVHVLMRGSTSRAPSRWRPRPRSGTAARSTAGCARSTSSTLAWGSSRSTPPATWTARSASPTRATSPTGTRSPRAGARPLLDAFVGRRGRTGGGDVLRRGAHHPPEHRGVHRAGAGQARQDGRCSTPTASAWPHDRRLRRRTWPSWRCTSTCSSTGSSEGTHLAIRGRDLRQAKRPPSTVAPRRA